MFYPNCIYIEDDLCEVPIDTGISKLFEQKQ